MGFSLSMNAGLYKACMEMPGESECTTIDVGDHVNGGGDAAMILFPLSIVCLTVAAALDIAGKLPQPALGVRVVACIFALGGVAGAAAAFDESMDDAKAEIPGAEASWGACLPLAVVGLLLMIAGTGFAVKTQPAQQVQPGQ